MLTDENDYIPDIRRLDGKILENGGYTSVLTSES